MTVHYRKEKAVVPNIIYMCMADSGRHVSGFPGRLTSVLWRTRDRKGLWQTEAAVHPSLQVSVWEEGAETSPTPARSLGQMDHPQGQQSKSL